MRPRIIHRVLVAVVLVSVAGFGVSAWLAGRAQQRALAAEVERQALVLSNTIRSATRQAMLLNERQMVHRIIEQIGSQEELGTIRVYNREGTVIYSPAPELVGTRVDKHFEACDACHVGGGPPKALESHRRTRTFTDASGDRQLGVITPIYNEPSCSSAACHAHAADQEVLGVLDVTLSLAEVDRSVAASRRTVGALALLGMVVMSLALAAVFQRLVGRPVGQLLAATNALGEGNLDYRIPVRRHDELGQLAASFNDMTAHLADARHQVYQSNKLASVGRLAAGIAHEINNPLTGVLTYSSFLLKRATDDETRSDLETIVHETKRCRDIVRGLLDFARQVPPHKSMIAINDVVARALGIVDNQLRVQNVEVVQHLAADLPDLHADPNQLQQVLINLLVNAADAFEGPERRIEIATGLAEEAERLDGRPTVAVRVADNGKGIPERDLGKIFEPFFTTKEHKGTGLGLAVSWGIVSEHGGTIEVASEVGRGTTFTVRLPVGQADAIVERSER